MKRRKLLNEEKLSLLNGEISKMRCQNCNGYIDIVYCTTPSLETVRSYTHRNKKTKCKEMVFDENHTKENKL